MEIFHKDIALRNEWRNSEKYAQVRQEADALIERRFNQWALEYEFSAKTAALLRDDVKRINDAKPARYPKPKLGMFFTLPQRKSRATNAKNLMRRLAMPRHLAERYVWYFFDHCRPERVWDDPEPDPVIEFEKWSDWRVRTDQFEREETIERKAFRAVCKRVQRWCKAARVPLEIELIGSTVLWAYSGDQLNGLEIDQIVSVWRSSAEANLCRYTLEPAENGVQRGSLFVVGTPKALNARFGGVYSNLSTTPPHTPVGAARHD